MSHDASSWFSGTLQCRMTCHYVASCMRRTWMSSERCHVHNGLTLLVGWWFRLRKCESSSSTGVLKLCWFTYHCHGLTNCTYLPHSFYIVFKLGCAHFVRVTQHSILYYFFHKNTSCGDSAQFGNPCSCRYRFIGWLI